VIGEKIMKRIPPASLFGKLLAPALLGLLVALVLLQANPMTSYPSRDGGSFAFIGSMVLKGKLPYIDAWDNKPPGVFYLNALALWTGRGTRWGIWLMEYVFLFFSAWIGYRLMRSLWQPSAAIIATAIWLLGLNGVLSRGNFTEEYSLLFNFLAAWLFWLNIQRPEKLVYDFLIGVTLAASFLLRENAIGVQVSIVLAWVVVLLVGKKLKLLLVKMVLLGAGVLPILFGVCAYFWARGALRAMIEAAILYNFAYAGGHANLVSGFVSGFRHLGFTAWIALAGYVSSIVLLVRSLRAKSLDAFTLFLVIGWPVEIVLSSISGRDYGHYFISWVPMIGLLSGMALSYLGPLIFAPKIAAFLSDRSNYVTAALLVFSTIFFWDGLVAYKNTFSRIAFDRESGIEKMPPIVQYIRANTGPGDAILAWGGEGVINFIAHRDAPSAYSFYPLFVDSPIRLLLDNGFFHDLTTRPPILIVDASIDAPDDVLSLDPKVRAGQIAAGKGLAYRPPHIDQVFEFIRQNYTRETVVDDYAVYRLNRP
jgi:hypothetical protein